MVVRSAAKSVDRELEQGEVSQKWAPEWRNFGWAGSESPTVTKLRPRRKYHEARDDGP